jgi:Primase X
MLGSSPTIIKSGSGGFHFHQPIEAFVLEQEQFFLSKSANGEPSKEFLRFAEKYLTNYKSDPAHNPSFKSCMIRIPGSINSKNGKEVKIVQKWDGVTRPKINLLLYEFSRWLIYNRVKVRSKPVYQQQQIQQQQQQQYNNNNIGWIESLLKRPVLLSDYRKRSIWRILAPYLVNTRKLSHEESSDIMIDWLNKCNPVERLDFNAKSLVKEKLANVGNYYPIGLEKLKEDNKSLYDIVISSL